MKLDIKSKKDDAERRGQHGCRRACTDQVKEAREKDIRLVTDHGMLDIVSESDVRGKTVRAAWLGRLRNAGARSRLEAR